MSFVTSFFLGTTETPRPKPRRSWRRVTTTLQPECFISSGWIDCFTLATLNIYHGKGMAVSCHHEKLATSQGLFYPHPSCTTQEDCWKVPGWFLYCFATTSMHIFVGSDKMRNMCSQKPWHYQKQKNVFQNSWSSTLLWPMLPQEVAMHTSNSWCCSLFPKAPGPSITN